jgi:hypothetical protein
MDTPYLQFSRGKCHEMVITIRRKSIRYKNKSGFENVNKLLTEAFCRFKMQISSHHVRNNIRIINMFYANTNVPKHKRNVKYARQ